MKSYEEIKALIEERVQEKLDKAIELSDFLADHPEIAAEEFVSSQKIVEVLRGEGFAVEYPYCNIATASAPPAARRSCPMWNTMLLMQRSEHT